MENDINLELRNTSIFQEGVKSLIADCENYTNSSSPSIYMVPGVIRNLSPRSFSPQAVSIGPLHKQDENVQAFEKWKPCFLIDLLNRIHSPKEEILELCMQKVLASMERIKTYYVWTTKYDDVEIAKMMVMDACFILESVYWAKGSKKSHLGINLRPQTVLIDLILLENQIPFFFLDEIYKCTISRINQPNHSLIDFIHPLIQKYFKIFNNVVIQYNNISYDNIHHLLSLLHQCYKPPDDVMPKGLPPIIPSAKDLDRAGVNFKPCENPTWLMEMKVRFPYFIGNWGYKPTLIMPQLIVQDSTELILRNLIAFEQSGQTREHITSYVVALDMLVNTEEDVAKLAHSKVLINCRGSNQEVADIINNVGNELVVLKFFYNEQWRTLYNYYNGVWPKHIAWLKRTYFSSPWNVIALFAGIILFVLTVVQTIFTIKPT